MKNEPTQNVKLNVINQHIIFNHMITKILMNGCMSHQVKGHNSGKLAL